MTLTQHLPANPGPASGAATDPIGHHPATHGCHLASDPMMRMRPWLLGLQAVLFALLFAIATVCLVWFEVDWFAAECLSHSMPGFGVL